MEYDIGTLEYLFSGSLPEAGGVKSLERLLYLGAVKVPISLLATLSKWIAAAWTGAKCEHQQYTPFSHHSFPSENLSYKDAATKQKKKEHSNQTAHRLQLTCKCNKYSNLQLCWSS